MDYKNVLAAANKEIKAELYLTESVSQQLEKLLAENKAEELFKLTDILRAAERKLKQRILNITSTPGCKPDELKDKKVAFALTIEGSYREKSYAVNKKFGSKHSHTTIYQWLSDHYKRSI